MRKLKIIDWISTPNHRNFNDAFISCLHDREFELIVFDEKLNNESHSCQVMKRCNNRFLHALSILRLIIKTSQPILLITYDPLYIYLLHPYFHRLYVFEHNTVPESASSKHAIFQKLFLRKLRRLTQYSIQEKFLKNLKQDAFYIGSPINSSAASEQKIKKTKLISTMLAPGARADAYELLRYHNILKDFHIKMKTNAQKPGTDTHLLKIQFEETIPFSIHTNNNIDAIIITSGDTYRGSGWINDAISARVPIIITRDENKKIFSETFNGFNFIDLDKISSAQCLEKRLLSNSYIAEQENITKHNKEITKRISSYIDQ